MKLDDGVTAHTLILFDIDGTLVDVHGAGRRAFSLALAEAFGVHDDLSQIVFAGATDLGVLQQLRMRYELEPSKEAGFFRVMERHLNAQLIEEPPALYQGVEACLERWLGMPGVVPGLVTGNARRCAHVKLEAAGIDGARFDVGGYGDEHHDRDVLAHLAVERAERGRGVRITNRYLVGDTPSDIVAAHAIDAVAVGVTTGRYGRESLLEAGAHVVVDSLEALRPMVT